MVKLGLNEVKQIFSHLKRTNSLFSAVYYTNILYNLLF
jgi:hypothetical protein